MGNDIRTFVFFFYIIIDVKLICLHPSDVSYQNFPNKEFLDNQIQPIQITSTVIFKPFRKTRISNEEYKRIVDDFKPDVIHSNLYESEFVAYSYIRNGTKYFSHTHDNMPRLKGFSLATLWNKRKFTDYYESCWLKKRYGLANANFICISEDNKNALQKNIGKGFSKITCFFLLTKYLEITIKDGLKSRKAR